MCGRGNVEKEVAGARRPLVEIQTGGAVMYAASGPRYVGGAPVTSMPGAYRAMASRFVGCFLSRFLECLFFVLEDLPRPRALKATMEVRISHY